MEDELPKKGCLFSDLAHEFVFVHFFELIKSVAQVQFSFRRKGLWREGVVAIECIIVKTDACRRSFAAGSVTSAKISHFSAVF